MSEVCSKNGKSAENAKPNPLRFADGKEYPSEVGKMPTSEPDVAGYSRTTTCRRRRECVRGARLRIKG